LLSWLLALCATFLPFVGLVWGLRTNTLLPSLVPVALLALDLVWRARNAEPAALRDLERGAFRYLGFAVLPVALGFSVGSLDYVPQLLRARRATGSEILAFLALMAAWLFSAVFAQLLTRHPSDGTRWRRTVIVLLVMITGVSAVTALRSAGLGWKELPTNAVAVAVGDGWTMRRILCPGLHPVGTCGVLQGRWPEDARSATNYESRQPIADGGGAVMVIEMTLGAAQKHEPLRGRRVWVAHHRERDSWRLCSGGPARGPCVDSRPTWNEDDGDSDSVLRGVPIMSRVVGDIPCTWIFFPMLGAFASLALLWAAAKERNRWRGVREGEHEGRGWVRWNDGTTDHVPGVQDLPAGPVLVREHRRSADLIYRGGPALDAEVWSGALSPKLQLSAARADLFNAMALLVIVYLGAPIVAAAWAVW
jgi:hypothetical protein